VKPDASDAAKAAAKQKATELAAKARAKPDSFAELAKANSQDPGSSAQGGDLGSFGRGAMVKAFYEQNPAQFQTPEVAKIEYLLLTQDAIAAQIRIDPAEVRHAYDANAKQYTTNEERQASHILIAVKPDASAAEKAAAKKKAEELAEKARAKPDAFAELAKANSQDPGSAAQGGDLGSFARGAMVKPFEDAVFAAKVGDIVGPVETSFGYHVIKVTGITPAHVQAFDEVKGRIEADLKRQ
jgi:peptidyl-prolyl cis-trans isomerase D